MRGTLAPHLQDFIYQLNQATDQAIADGVIPSPELARANLEKLGAFVTQIPDLTYARKTHITNAQQVIPLRVYSPKPEQALPVMIYFHGGGHMCGSTELYDPLCRKMAMTANCVVVSVEYRLAPEHPYPQGLDDCEYVVRHVEQALTDVAHSDQIIIGGDSGGGAICTSLVMRQVTDNSLNIDRQVLIYPSVDYTLSCPSVNENGTGYLLELTKIKWYFDHYFLNSEDRIQTSPLYNPVVASSPETLVITAGCDPLRDEGLAYAEKLQEQGVKVTTYNFANMIHAFMNLEDLVPNECAELYRQISKFINT